MNVFVPINIDEVFDSIPITNWIEKIEEHEYIVLSNSYSNMLHRLADMIEDGDKEQAGVVVKEIVEALLEDHAAIT